MQRDRVRRAPPRASVLVGGAGVLLLLLALVLLGGGRPLPLQQAGRLQEPEQDTDVWVTGDFDMSAFTEDASARLRADEGDNVEEEIEDEEDSAAGSTATAQAQVIEEATEDEEEKQVSIGGNFTSGIHLISTFFKGSYSKQRFSEILRTLVLNLRNPYITNVHMLWEDVSPLEFLKNATLVKKLVLTKVDSQPTYRTMLTYADENLKRGTIAMIANGDIYFGDTLACLKPVRPENVQRWDYTNLPPGVFRPLLALSRRKSPICGDRNDYYKIFDLCLSYHGSHDVFIFAPPVGRFLADKLGHKQNRLGSENLVIWWFEHTKEWKAKNPCELIRGNHLHCTQERAYTTRTKEGRLIFISHGRAQNGTSRHGSASPEDFTGQCPITMF